MGGKSDARLPVVAVAVMASLPFLRVIAANSEDGPPFGRFLFYWLAIALPAGLIAKKSRRLGTALAILIYIVGGLAVTIQKGLSVPEMLGVSGLVWVSLVLTSLAILMSRWELTSKFVVVLAGLLVTVPLLRLVLDMDLAQALVVSEEPASWAIEEPSTRPNIYWLMFDGYGHVDNPEFEEALNVRGFTISHGAAASYPLTTLSLASTLKGEYLQVGAAQAGLDRILSGDNPLVGTLKEWGYTYALYPADGFDGTSCIGYEDVCLDGSGLSEFDWALLRQTPIPSLMASTSSQVHDQRADPRRVVTLIEERGLKGPYFTFAHLLNPHPPYYRSGEDCALRQIEHDLAAGWGTRTEYRQAVDCLNQRIEIAVDQILDRDLGAVVILQGDHGPRFDFDVYSGPLTWTEDQIHERLGVFSAIRMSCPVPDDLAVVNTVHLLAGCLSDRNPPMLPMRQWIMNFVGEWREIASPGS